MGFAGQHIACLGIAAVELRLDAPPSGGKPVLAAVDIEPIILALKEQRSVVGSRFDTVDLGAGDIGDGAGREQRGRIDAQLRTIAQGQGLGAGREARGLHQPFRVAAEMQRIIVAADDLAGCAHHRADCSVAPSGLRLEAEWIAPVVGPVA